MLKKLTELSVGEQLTKSDWLKITQADIDLFAQATGDKQWIHVDPLRCVNESPFKSTIAHGYLSVTLMPNAFYQMFVPDPAYPTILNYGVDKIRFLEPVRVDDQIRFISTLAKVEQKASGLLFYFETEVEIAHRAKPAMKGTFLMLLLGAQIK
ncbi:MaoC family dehydratase [Paraglaciecola hydrolytica]|uniref:Dehydratase n=1 Tax=Paraglaciecola hydrolytica TaxID=1799789 RepID=A0A148KN37_9ALTE|nr:MaoC family dehydratase [Paraglaciecola hydrolytica]KXI27736.1 dehydratase [Paraglaciecola hydrolytica]